MVNHQRKIFYPIVFLLISLLTRPVLAEDPKPGVIYDIQCGCFSDPLNSARFAERLQELGLAWYNIPSEPCTRFIVDVNVDWLGISYFINDHVEFMDAFLVKNHWDVPFPELKNSPPIPSKDLFTKVMAPYMQKQYKFGYYNPERRSMKDERAIFYTKTIYEAAEYYQIDPFLLFALGNFESYFSNILGDLNRLKRKVPDPAQGIFQILRSTARFIYDDMKRQGLPHAPETFPSDLINYPEAQIYFAAHYLSELHKEHNGNRYMALLFYNARSKPNYHYPRKVMRFYEQAMNYFFKSMGQPNPIKPLMIEAAKHSREQNQHQPEWIPSQ
ncbi:MAG: transglycosylase SLT domain-containing protein [Deltaproteobacteria bacterium]|nr:transglycosylase SLT domain-containing protein [Deltaproteobacteria bacterium]